MVFITILWQLKKRRCEVPGYLGVFLKAIINEIGHITCFFHSTKSNIEKKELDFFISDKDITFIDLGPKKAFYARMLQPGKVFENNPSA